MCLGKAEIRVCLLSLFFPVLDLGCLMLVSACKGHGSCCVLGLASKQGSLGLGSYRR